MKINIYRHQDGCIGVVKNGGKILRSYDFFGRMAIYNDNFSGKDSGGFVYIGTYITKSRSWKEIIEESKKITSNHLTNITDKSPSAIENGL
ncbi:MAG: hypothetical protein ACYDDE_00600 [bacterium]